MRSGELSKPLSYLSTTWSPLLLYESHCFHLLTAHSDDFALHPLGDMEIETISMDLLTRGESRISCHYGQGLSNKVKRRAEKVICRWIKELLVSFYKLSGLANPNGYTYIRPCCLLPLFLFNGYFWRS